MTTTTPEISLSTRIRSLIERCYLERRLTRTSEARGKLAHVAIQLGAALDGLDSGMIEPWVAEAYVRASRSYLDQHEGYRRLMDALRVPAGSFE